MSDFTPKKAILPRRPPADKTRLHGPKASSLSLTSLGTAVVVLPWSAPRLQWH